MIRQTAYTLAGASLLIAALAATAIGSGWIHWTMQVQGRVTSHAGIPRSDAAVGIVLIPEGNHAVSLSDLPANFVVHASSLADDGSFDLQTPSGARFFLLAGNAECGKHWTYEIRVDDCPHGCTRNIILEPGHCG